MNATLVKTQHKSFSPARVAAIAGNTLLELIRLKVFYFLLIFAVIIIGSTGFTTIFDFKFNEQIQLLKDVSLGAMSTFTLILAVLTTAMMLPKDIEDRTLYTILAKPVPRFEYLLGKLLGVFLLLLISVVAMSIMFSAALYAKQQYIANITVQEDGGRLSAADLQATLDDLKAHTFTKSLIPCIAAIYLKSALFATLTLMVSTFASSLIFTIFISFSCYLIGAVEGVAREYARLPGTSEAVKAFITMIALFFPDLQLFNLTDDIAAGNPIAMALFLKTVGLGLAYIAVYWLVSYLVFTFKEL